MNTARNISSTTESLEETRGSSRTFGCVGFSIVAHLAFLAALAVIPETILSTGGDNAGGRESGTVSLVDSSASADSGVSPSEIATAAGGANTALNAESLDAVEASVLTDPQSDIVMPAETAVVVKPKVKVETAVIAPVPKKQAPKPVVAAKVPQKTTPQPEVKTEEAARPVMEEENEPAPVLLANPPSDDQEAFDAKAEPVAEEEEKQQPEPAKPVAVVEEEPVPVKPAVVAKQEAPKQEPKKEEPKKEKLAVVAAPSKGENESPTESSKSASAVGESAATDKAGRASEASDENSSSGGTGGQGGTATNAGDKGDAKEGSGESNGAVAGPIRDASELKALPGNPNPVYPARDRLARKEGTSVILGRVSADGRISEVTVERSSGSAQMDSASAQAFRSWRFQGGQQGWVRKPFQFKLVGDAKEVPAPLGKALKR